jgi:hypothetical protein
MQVVDAGGKEALTDLIDSQPLCPGQCTFMRLLYINVLCTQLGGRGWREGSLARPASQPRDPGQCGAPKAPRPQEDEP